MGKLRRVRSVGRRRLLATRSPDSASGVLAVEIWQLLLGLWRAPMGGRFRECPDSMTPLDQLEFTTRVAKRAQYEAFEFAISDGGVVVQNCSHENPADHEYLVTIEDGLPAACECPADAHFDGACKHRVAVAIREPVLDAAVAGTVAADGGTTTEDGRGPEVPDDDSDCDCEQLRDDFPCWECVRTGQRNLPD
jgi:hypothetical protein